MGGKFHPSKLEGHIVNEHRARERLSMQKVLKNYLAVLQELGVWIHPKNILNLYFTRPAFFRGYVRIEIDV